LVSNTSFSIRIFHLFRLDVNVWRRDGVGDGLAKFLDGVGLVQGLGSG
jgi:hypothetical protein